MCHEATLLELSSLALVAVAGSNTYWARHRFMRIERKVEGYGVGSIRMIQFRG
jgi:hypothetical protein